MAGSARLGLARVAWLGSARAVVAWLALAPAILAGVLGGPVPEAYASTSSSNSASSGSPGYWEVASDGGVYAFGTTNFGSERGHPLNAPIVGAASTPDSLGYWLVASDGGIFTFGDAGFYGSMGGKPLNAPVVGMAADPATGGYWEVASDGGIFSFNAPFYGSMGGKPLNQPMVGMAAVNGGGYWTVASDGGIFSFGDPPFLGSTGGNPGPAPIVTMVGALNGYPFPPGSSGYDVSNFQCGKSLPPSQPVAVVEVAGAIDGSPNPCYAEEAAWGGSNLSSYIFMDGLPSPAPAEAQSGPAGTCNGDVACESYNFGYYWAAHWVNYSRGLGYSPDLWWLDVETAGSWSQDTSSNAQVIAGAVAGLRASGVLAGIYATNLQWGQIAGNSLSFPGMPLWVPGAGNISGGTYSAQNFCAGTVSGRYASYYAPFAGGRIVLVQYGYTGNGYSGPPSSFDQDYACP